MKSMKDLLPLFLWSYFGLNKMKKYSIKFNVRTGEDLIGFTVSCVQPGEFREDAILSAGYNAGLTLKKSEVEELTLISCAPFHG